MVLQLHFVCCACSAIRVEEDKECAERSLKRQEGSTMSWGVDLWVSRGRCRRTRRIPGCSLEARESEKWRHFLPCSSHVRLVHDNPSSPETEVSESEK